MGSALHLPPQRPSSCHSFRQSPAVHLLGHGYGSRAMEELLGHRDVAMTMIYAHVLNRGSKGEEGPLDEPWPRHWNSNGDHMTRRSEQGGSGGAHLPLTRVRRLVQTQDEHG